MGGTRGLLLACLVVAAACSPSSSELGEVAAELRALRLQVRTAPSSAADKPQVAEALSPLRTALDGLLATQRDLQAQQVELAREMHRWTQLAAQPANAARSEEGLALVRRLQELEQKMAQQEARHREVETLLRGALDRTSERLESFLLQLQSVPRPTATQDAASPAPPAPPPATTGANEPKQGAVHAGSGARAGGAASLAVRTAPLGWWMLLLGSVLVGGHLFVRALRGRWSNAVRGRDAAREAAPAHGASPLAAPAPPLQSAEEIWAAAALLGEAVDRLRRGKDAVPTGPSSPRQQPGDLDFAGLDADVDDRDLFVVDGLDDLAVAADAVEPDTAAHPVLVPTPATPAAAPAAAVPPTREPVAMPRTVASVLPRRAPAQLSFRLRPRDPAHACSALLKILREDPRVLQRPEPRVQGTGSEVVCQFAVLPGLPAGECSVIEQRLRDSVG
jgi:hypothetical protein